MDTNALIECPYNKAHQILRSRMQTHLFRCRKNYPDTNKSICIFDATHHINEPEMPFHLEECSSRINYDQSRYATTECSNLTEDLPSVMLPPPTEDWDSEAKVPSYNPLETIQEKNVIAKKQCVQPLEKKKFRLEQRQKFASEMAGKPGNKN